MSHAEVHAPTVRTGSVTVDGDRIFFDVRGTGTPIVLLPGTPGDASAYGLIAQPLSSEHTVVTLDPRGFGRSVGREPRRYEIGQQARDVAAVIRAAGLDRAIVFGSSAGAEIGLELAKNHPDVVSGLIAHEAPVVRVLPDIERLEEKIAEIYRTAWTEGPKQAFFDFLLLTQLPFNAGKPFTAAEVDSIRPNVESLPGLDFVPFYVKYQMLPLTSYKPDLAAIAENGVPVRAAAGELSLNLPFGRTSRQIADAFNSSLLIFPGHHGSYSDPSVADSWLAALRTAVASF